MFLQVSEQQTWEQSIPGHESETNQPLSLSDKFSILTSKCQQGKIQN